MGRIGSVINSKTVKKLGESSKSMLNFGTLIGGTFVGIDTYSNMKQGDGLIKAGVKAGATYLAYDALGAILGTGPMIALGLAQGAKDLTNTAIEHGRNNAQNGMVGKEITGGGAIGGGHFKTSEIGETMRQRQLEQLGGYSNLIRGTLGNEGRRRALMARYY